MTKKGERSNPWSAQDHHKMIQMVRADKSWSEIATALNRTVMACKTRYRDFRAGVGRGRKRDVIEAAIAVRAATSSLAHQSITAAFFGDPLPGRSALDQRQAEPSIRSISLGGAR